MIIRRARLPPREAKKIIGRVWNRLKRKSNIAPTFFLFYHVNHIQAQQQWHCCSQKCCRATHTRPDTTKTPPPVLYTFVSARVASVDKDFLSHTETTSQGVLRGISTVAGGTGSWMERYIKRRIIDTLIQPRSGPHTPPDWIHSQRRYMSILHTTFFFFSFFLVHSRGNLGVAYYTQTEKDGRSRANATQKRIEWRGGQVHFNREPIKRSTKKEREKYKLSFCPCI